MTEAYPLYWPEGKPRTRSRSRSNFKVSMALARDELFRELALLGGKNIIVSTNIKLRQDGLPYASNREPDDPGVAVYFEYKGNKVCFACDRWDLVKDNMQAVRHTINALRGIARWGTGDMVEAAFRGFTAIAPPQRREWWDVLQVSKVTPLEEIEAKYRALARQYHPDSPTGNMGLMQELNEAIRLARIYNHG